MKKSRSKGRPQRSALHGSLINRCILSALVLSELFAYYSFGPVSFPDFILFLVLGITACHVTLRGRLTRTEVSIGIIIAAIIVLVFLNWLTATRPNMHAATIPGFFGVLATVGVLTYWSTSIRALFVIRRTLIILAIIAVSGAFLQGILGIDIIPNPKVTPSRLAELGIYIDIPSSTGFIRSHETLGVYINTASFLMMMGLFKEGRRIFGASLPVATISPFFVLLGLLLVQSRSTLVAFIIGLSVFVVLSLYSSDGKSKLSVLLTGLPVMTITGYTLMNNWESFVAINAEGVLARFEQARTALDLIASRPWWGYGFFANQEIFGHRHILHNTPLMIAVGIGLPGLILYLSLFATAAYSGLKCLGSDDWRAPMAIALLSALTASFAELNNYNGILNTGVYPIIGTLIALDNWNISYTTHKPKIKL